jgi:intracellular septation protein A
MNNLLYALRPLLADFLPTIVFAALVALHMDVATAILVSLAIGLAEVAVQKLRKQPVELLQWASLALVVVFGGLGLMMHDARFLMLKPTIIYAAVGAVMLKKGWMVRYLPPIAGEHGRPLMVGWGYVWAGLMFATSIANGVVAWQFPHQWPAFIAAFPLASKLALFAVNYASVRFMVRRKILAERALPAPAAEVQAA